MRRLLLFLLFLVPFGGLCAAPVELYLKWKHQFQFAGFYAAISQGYYREAGLEVTLIERQKDLAPVTAVLDQPARYGISDSSLVLDRMQGRPVVVVAAIFQHSPLALATRAADRLISPLELKGKRVMLQDNVDDAVLTAMFHEMGLEKSDFVLLPHAFNDDLLIDKKVDALSVYGSNQPFYYKQKGISIHLIEPINYGIDFYGDMIFTSQREVEQNPERVQAFRKASLKGWDYALKHPAEVVDLILSRYGPDKTREHLLFEAEELRKMIRPDLIELGYTSASRFQRIADIYTKEGFAPQVELEGLLVEDYLGGKQRSQRVLLVLATLAGVAIVLAVLLALFNRRLKQRVIQRTRNLVEAKEALNQYVGIVDKYVITSSTDRHGVITDVSEAFCHISGYSKDELLGRAHNIVRHPDMPQSLYQEMWKELKAGKSWCGEIKNLKKDGGFYWVLVNIEPVLEAGHVVGYTAIRQDITDRKEVEAQAVTDRLTQLANRMKLDQVFEQEIARVRRYNHPLSVILFDLDHFKSVNDQWGHQVGDLVLQEVAQIAQLRVREADTLGRWGGEEFMVICPETDLEGARQLAEKLRSALEEHQFPKVERKTASFGVAQLAGDEEGPEALVKRADDALYQAKESGRNQVKAQATP
ncbi:MAG: diguanylate cyclase [bacterium]|nr:diguanylate cyclase [bacterium]